MHIAINCRSFLRKNPTGIGRYAFNLVQSLSRVDRENFYTLYSQKDLFDFKRRLPCRFGKNFHARFDYFRRGANCVLGDLDLYHAPGLEDLTYTKGKLVVTVHDVIHKTYPEGHAEETCDTLDRQLKEITKHADRLIGVSKSTLDDIRKFYDVPADKLSLVYQGVDKEVFFPLREPEIREGQQVLEKSGIDGPFLLFVGTIEPRKNLKNLLLAFSRLKTVSRYPGKLVIVGMKGWMMEEMETILSTLDVKADCLFPGYVSDEALRFYYGLADVFVYPSFYEGFGFPILEAICCGAAVVTSNVSACPEVAGEAALKVDPNSPEDIASAIAQILGNPSLKAELKIKARKRAEDFSFDKTAKETLAIYQEVVGTK